MHTLYLLSVWLHILAAAVWIGGMVFLGVVLIPVLRQREPRSVRTQLLYQTALRFRWAGSATLGLLMVTGIANLGFRGYGWSDLWSGALWQGAWGHTLGWKLALVGLVLAVSAAHDFYLGPRATRVMKAQPDSPEAKRWRRLSSWVGRLTVLLSLVIL